MQSKLRKVRRGTAIVAACTLAVLTLTPEAQGQWGHQRHRRYGGGTSLKIGALGGATFPRGTTKNGVDPGWQAGALIDLTDRRIPFGIRLSGSYQHLVPSSATATGAANIWGGDFNLLLTIPGRIPLKPYLTGGVGLYRVKNNITASTNIAPGPTTDFAWNGGAGLRSDIGGFGVFLETHYLQIFTTGHDLRLMPVTFGIMVGSF